MACGPCRWFLYNSQNLNFVLRSMGEYKKIAGPA